MFVGLIGVLISFYMKPVVGWVDYLVCALFVTTLAVSSLFFMAVSGVLQASWLTPYKRIPEAMSSVLPIAMVLMLVTIGGMHTLYEWTHADVVANDPILKEKVAWLNTPGFIIRMVVIFLIWLFLGWKFRSLSALQWMTDEC